MDLENVHRDKLNKHNHDRDEKLFAYIINSLQNDKSVPLEFKKNLNELKNIKQIIETGVEGKVWKEFKDANS